MKFEEILKGIREENDISQRELALDSRLSPTLISRIESGHEIPSDKAGEQIINALKKIFQARQIDNISLAKLTTALKDKKSRKNRKHISYDNVLVQRYSKRFAQKLKEIIEDLGINTIEFSDGIHRSNVSAGHLLAGRLLPSDETLQNKIINFLHSKQVNEEDIERLKNLHLCVQLSKLLDLKYLNEDDKKLMKSFIQRTGRQKEKN